MASGVNRVDEDLEEQLQATKKTAERCLELLKKQQRESGSVDIAFNSTVENLLEQLAHLSQLMDNGVLEISSLPLGGMLAATLNQLHISLPLQPPPGAEASLLDHLKTAIVNFRFKSDQRYGENVRLRRENQTLSQQLLHCEKQLRETTAAKNTKENELYSLQHIFENAMREHEESERRVDQMIKEREMVEREKNEAEQNAQAQIRSLRDKANEARHRNDVIREYSDAQIRSLREELQVARENEEESERRTTERTASLKQELEREKAEKREIRKKLQQAQQERENAMQRFSSLLEKEIKLGEEFRCRLRQYESQKDFQTLTLEALSRIEKRQEEAATIMADIELRKQQDSLDEDFMNRLPDDVKVACLRIQRLIGGMGREFGERLLGRYVAWSREELEGSGLFFTRSKFWLCIRKWVEASSVPNTDAPLTLDHLTSVCNKLRVNPTILEEISEEQESNLERNFVFLAKHAMVVEVAAFFRNKLKLTEEAWTFLLMPGTSRQKMDRLLAVVYSMGQEGYNLLLEALRSSCQRHVVARLTGEDADIDVLCERTKTGIAEREPTADPYPDDSFLTTAAMAAVDADRDNTSRKTPVDADRDDTSKKTAVDANRDDTSKKTPVDANRDDTSKKTPVEADRDNTSRKTPVDADRDNTSKKTPVDADRDNTSRKTPVDADRDNTSKKTPVDADRDNTSKKTPVDADRDNTSKKTPVDADRDNTSKKTPVEADRDNASTTTAVEADRDNTFKKSCSDRTPDPSLSNEDEQPATVKAMRNLLEETTAQIRQLLVEQFGNFKESLTGEMSRTDQAAKAEGRYIVRVCPEEFTI